NRSGISVSNANCDPGVVTSARHGLTPRNTMAVPVPLICVGHAALDRIYRIESLPPEPTKIRALEHIEVGGGMAANAAVTAARLGARAELWSRVGDDQAGVAIRNGLKAEKVDIRYVHAF